MIFGQPDITELEIQAVSDVLRSQWLSTGQMVRKLEEEFAAHIGSGYAVAVNSATMGLMLSLAVACIGDGQTVLTSPLTFAATINACLAMRVRPRFIDVDIHGNMNPDLLENMRQLDGDVRGIIPVHYTGAACEMQRIMNYASMHQLKVIEDAAHAFGADYYSPSSVPNQLGARKRIGTIGDFTVFSLYATKNITAGEGGIVMTKRGEYAERLRTLSNQGQSDSAWTRYSSGPIRAFDVIHPGYKGNLSDVHAAIALTQLRRWEAIRAHREAIWNLYEDAFGFKEPGHSQHLFTIRIKNREVVRKKLYEMGIGTGVHYRPLHLEPGFHFLGYKPGDFPMAEKIGAETLSLPITAAMTVDDAKRVIDAVQRIKEDVENV